MAQQQTLHDTARSQIRKWIHSTEITQAKLAERIGRNQAWMSRYLTGGLDTDLDTLNQIAEVFGHSLMALLAVPEDPHEATLLQAYRALQPATRTHVLNLILELSRAHRKPRRRAKR